MFYFAEVHFGAVVSSEHGDFIGNWFQPGNQIRRLDEEDAEFLSSVTQKQTEMLKQNKIEEQLALKELKVCIWLTSLSFTSLRSL